MKCKSCLSANQRPFPAEINIHFSGIEGFVKPSVWAFPRLMICLDCGSAEFILEDRELRAFREDN